MSAAVDNLKVSETKDPELIRRVLTHPSVYRWVVDDGTPPEAFHPPVGPLYLKVESWDTLLGLFVLVRQNAITSECHVCLLPEGYGEVGRQAGREALAWIWANTTIQKLVGRTPANHFHALRYARLLGFKGYGWLDASFLKDGEFIDEWCSALDRPGRFA
jgi:RimJ/RimL family protein N-acetyltransferase